MQSVSTTNAADLRRDAGLDDITHDFAGGRPVLNSTRQNATTSSGPADDNVARLTEAYRAVLAGIGEDPGREGLLKTPERAAKAMMYFTKGYTENAAGKVGLFMTIRPALVSCGRWRRTARGDALDVGTPIN